ncbi:IS5 family transposase [Acidovorax delafieldii]|nr:IS5 family transposase [Acidovorax delafieldii]
MKLHIGVDSQMGLSHGAVVTAANVHDKHPLPELLHGNEQRVYGDSAYARQKALIASKAPRAKDFTNQRTRCAGEVDEVQRAKNRNKSRVRARVEHVFAVVKRLWGFSKVRCRGLHKNATRAVTPVAVANIYLCRSHLLGQVRPYVLQSALKAPRTAQLRGARGPDIRKTASSAPLGTSRRQVQRCTDQWKPDLLTV